MMHFVVYFKISTLTNSQVQNRKKVTQITSVLAQHLTFAHATDVSVEQLQHFTEMQPVTKLINIILNFHTWRDVTS